MSLFKDKINKAKVIYEDMTLLINICENNSENFDMWLVFWDSFWELSREFPFEVDWCDYDTSSKYNIMQRYNALTEFMSGIYNTEAEGIGDE